MTLFGRRSFVAWLLQESVRLPVFSSWDAFPLCCGQEASHRAGLAREKRSSFAFPCCQAETRRLHPLCQVWMVNQATKQLNVASSEPVCPGYTQPITPSWLISSSIKWGPQLHMQYNASIGGGIHTPCNFSTVFSPMLWSSWELMGPCYLHCLDPLPHIINSWFYIKRLVGLILFSLYSSEISHVLQNVNVWHCSSCRHLIIIYKCFLVTCS
jgi:hypothetical protein